MHRTVYIPGVHVHKLFTWQDFYSWQIIQNYPRCSWVLFFNDSIGEPFTQEEMEEMLSAAVDPDKGIIFYKDFVSMMVVEDP